ncbi:FlgO family outer membrane protein [Pseudoalteromonas spongiae]|uniref:FlgO family outer membrane protein n=1 Tax=Pseudoalteromonas spongiae TaxID=298657 RepID=UPI000C2D0279|nr:FlgO family outer membrane protein [Pseudoalteromonas spongiae]
MKTRMVKSIGIASIAAVVVGCTTLGNNTTVAASDETTEQVDSRFQAYSADSFMANKGTVKEIKNINHYVRGLMHQLADNVKYVNQSTPIAVTSFVLLDSDLQKTNLVGNQIAESFIHEIHKLGLPVLDYKTTDFFRVSTEGDYIFSRDYMELRSDLSIDYVLSGTLTKHQKGYLVNARIIGIKSKAVVASAQGLVPDYAIKSLQNTKNNDGIPLRKG